MVVKCYQYDVMRCSILMDSMLWWLGPSGHRATRLGKPPTRKDRIVMLKKVADKHGLVAELLKHAPDEYLRSTQYSVCQQCPAA